MSKKCTQYTLIVLIGVVAVPLYNRKKVRIDMRQVVDAIFLACSNPTIDAFFIVCAPIDCQPMINMLKTLGKAIPQL